MSALNEDLLVEMVDEFLEPFGCDSDFSSDFSYDPEEERVYFSIIMSERADKLFKKYVARKFGFDFQNIFMLSLLHEVGHFYTLHTSSDFRVQIAHQPKQLIEQELERLTPDDPCYDTVYSNYFDLSIEKVATVWAVNYYKNNRKRCDDFYSKFEQTLKAEYERLGVTE